MMRRERKRIPGLNTTATADISFMLLLFFLMTSSLDTDRGLPRQLPPPEESRKEQDMLVKKRNVMEIALDARNRLTLDGDVLLPDELTSRVAAFVANEHNDPSMPEKSRREVNLLGLTEVSDRHVLSIEVSRESTYDAYFQMQNAIVRAYARLRNQLARRLFGRPYAQCSQEEREAIGMVYPQRISESVAESM